MRTAIIILGGFALPGLCLLAGRLTDGRTTMPNAAKLFIGVWLVGAAANMWAGVSHAGYSLADELTIFLVIFALPSAAAAFAWWRISRQTRSTIHDPQPTKQE